MGLGYAVMRGGLVVNLPRWQVVTRWVLAVCVATDQQRHKVIDQPGEPAAVVWLGSADGRTVLIPELRPR